MKHEKKFKPTHLTVEEIINLETEVYLKYYEIKNFIQKTKCFNLFCCNPCVFHNNHKNQNQFTTCIDLKFIPHSLGIQTKLYYTKSKNKIIEYKENAIKVLEKLETKTLSLQFERNNISSNAVVIKVRQIYQKLRAWDIFLKNWKNILESGENWNNFFSCIYYNKDDSLEFKKVNGFAGNFVFFHKDWVNNEWVAFETILNRPLETYLNSNFCCIKSSLISIKYNNIKVEKYKLNNQFCKIKNQSNLIILNNLFDKRKKVIQYRHKK